MRPGGQHRGGQFSGLAIVRRRRCDSRRALPSFASQGRPRARSASAATILRRVDRAVRAGWLGRFLQPLLTGQIMAEASDGRSSGNRANGNPARRIIARILFAAVIVTDLVLGAYVLRLYYLHPRTDDAYVRANIVGVAPQVSGTIVELPLRDNQHVQAGDVLFVIDPRPYQAELNLAQAQLALTNLQIEALDQAIGAAKAGQKRAEADADYERQYLTRLLPLEKE